VRGFTGFAQGWWMGEGKDLFFEKKKQKTFAHLASVFPGESEFRIVKVFWFFFSKKNCFLAYAA
jgi:hypothetical protein